MKKLDLARLFQVEDIVTPRSVLTETDKEIGDKPPYHISVDLKTCVDMMNDAARAGDIALMLKCIEGISRRTAILQESALNIKNMLGDD